MKLARCSFCCILLAKTSQKTSLYSSKEKQTQLLIGVATSHFAKGCGYRKRNYCGNFFLQTTYHHKQPQTELPISLFFKVP